MASPITAVEIELMVARNRDAERKRLGLTRYSEMRDRVAAQGTPRRSPTVTFEQRRDHRLAQRNVREARFAKDTCEIRGAAGSDLTFNGFACVTCLDEDDDSAAYDMEDGLGPWVESVLVGAFKKTLAQNCDVAFLLNHGGPTLARTKSGTLKLSERTLGRPTGLHCEAQLDGKNPSVAVLLSAIERGDLDEMSFAFRVTRHKWSDDYSRRWIQEVNLNQGDVSVVNYGANPHTGGLLGIKNPKKTPDPYMSEIGVPASGAGGYTETQGKKLLADIDLMVALNRDAERLRRSSYNPRPF